MHGDKHHKKGDNEATWNRSWHAYSRGFPDGSVGNLLAKQETQETQV